MIVQEVVESRQQVVSNTKPKGSRIAWIDYVKGVAIFLVVVGHAYAGLVNAGLMASSSTFRFIYSWLYSFHMPVFFFVSGILVVRSAQRSHKGFLVDKLKIVVYPYLVWSIIELMLMGALQKFEPGDIFGILVIPEMQFWYLYTLFIIYLIFVGMRMIKLDPQWFLLAGVGLFVGVNIFRSSSPYVLAKLADNMIYFAVGYVFHEQIKQWVAGLTIQRALGIVLLAFGVMSVLVYQGMFDYPALRLVLATLGITGSLALAAILEQIDLKVVRVWGILSLQIYLVHIIASAGVRMTMRYIFGIEASWIHLILGIAAGVYLPIGLAKLFERIGFHYAFTLRRRGYQQVITEIQADKA